ncbi:aldo/keto reductase [Novosphingobium rosa]|uniref:aldo/keto reductase n=1 Tax=Novosphingobium rosa TaxID=76978 RepID=UPI00082C6F2C|nr:aldo/keto reductase [Novosphingobium rosa]
MEYRPLGQTGMQVSAVCLGTMTWGSQNTQDEANAQIDFALDHGINFLDTAEMYPVTPVKLETFGHTEAMIGTWLAQSGKRDKIVLASKVSGPARWYQLRGGNRLDRRNIEEAIDGSLKRLKTDYLDLYQLHWPDRGVPMFGARGLQALGDDAQVVSLEETLGVMADLVKAGKIRAVGLSNETPWGVGEALRLARDAGLPRVASIQNAYSLLNRTFETGLSEFALREDVGLLAYSPLAAGYLSGKYLGGTVPAGSRLDVAKQFTRYVVPQEHEATARYVGIAHALGLTPVQLALGFVYSRGFVTSSIIGATSVEQLKENIEGSLTRLPEEALKAIADVYRILPDPCP